MTSHLAVALLLVIGGSLPAAKAAPDPAKGPYESAEDCARCHASIHKYWSEGPHSRSATSPVFLKAIEGMARSGSGAEGTRAAREACVWCHAPTVLATGDYGLTQAISREGITCDF